MPKLFSMALAVIVNDSHCSSWSPISPSRISARNISRMHRTDAWLSRRLPDVMTRSTVHASKCPRCQTQVQAHRTQSKSKSVVIDKPRTCTKETTAKLFVERYI
eukprot:235092-Amphidinium_carterae.1